MTPMKNSEENRHADISTERPMGRNQTIVLVLWKTKRAKNLNAINKHVRLHYWYGCVQKVYLPVN